MMNNSLKLAIWGAASVLSFGAIFFAQSAFGGLVVESDQGQGASGMGLVLVIGTALLAVAFIVAIAQFLRNIVVMIEARRGHQYK